MERTISDTDFTRISQFIHRQYGIHLPPEKKSLLEGRLRKRMKSLAIDDFRTYCDYLFTGQGMNDELPHMIDVVTTNKTDFFREPAHFHYLINEALPALFAGRERSVIKRLQVWSAACSTGEEPYTLAMVLSEFSASLRGFDFSILATDISTRVLDAAREAVYGAEKIGPVPPELRKKYLLKSRDPARKVVRIAPELREKVTFRRLNLAENHYAVPAEIQAIFCRNVLIYFDTKTQERIVRQFCQSLAPGGYLFLGHAESLNNLDFPLKYVAPTIYRKE